LIEGSGLCYEYKAWAVGKHRQAAKTEIEKLKLEELTINQLVRETVRILMTIRDEAKEKNVRIEMGWVGNNTNGRHEVNSIFILLLIYIYFSANSHQSC
jgi:20S proteasome subunit alpha 7